MARILIVEDEANNLDVAQRIVTAAGHVALTATDGVAALEIARAEHPEAVLIDLLLPRLDGWAVTRALREEGWAARIPIIAVSALAMQADRERALEAGCNDFVTKPYAPAELRAVLQRYFPEGANPTPRVPAAAQPRGAPAERLGKVLIVDDERANVELLSRRLRSIGCETFEALTGEEALAIAPREMPDLILLDVMMPGTDGWQTCRILKGDPRTAEIPVMFVTARDRGEDVARGFEAGGVQYLTKPFEAIELFARVRSAIYMKRLQDDLKKSNEDLRRLEQSRLELIGMLGHDIRNLANSVVAFLQLVRMGQLAPDQAEFAQLLGLSEANVTELLRMVNALLDVYKMEEGRLEAMPQAIALADLVRRSLAQVTTEAVAKGIVLRHAIPEDAMVFVDDSLIVRVLTNLVSNSVKHTPSAGSVTVEADAPPDAPDSVVVRVRDTGPGITVEDAPHVFDRFYQGRGRSRGGTGLGLAFCKLAVELHGGRIGVANPGAPGARIELTLPAASRVAERPVVHA